ncbi:MAG: peptide deformylase [Eubacteriales bacterium]|nr:peptide deformylase [Eubacteriales bacterium]
MAVRNVIKEGDAVLRKKSRTVDVIDDRIKTLLTDMAETLYSANGVGLAAPQVGVLRRVVVINVGEGLIELINPKIVAKKGIQTEAEGCLSVPEVYGVVNRPGYVEVEALDRDGKKIKVSGTDLLARCLCHEIDHLDGVLFIDKVVRFIEPSNNDN